MPAHLRLAPLAKAPRRPTLIVDVDGSMSPPWTLEEHYAMRAAPVPAQVVQGMWVAAWARAAHCPIAIVDCHLEPHTRYEPTQELWAAVAQTMGGLIGALGFAIPIQLNERRRAYAASWPFLWDKN